MRIVVDARKAADYGIGTYIRRLGAACARLSPSDEFIFLGGPEIIDGETRAAGAAGAGGPAHLLQGDNVSWAGNKSANYGVSELLSVSWQVRKLGADVFHAPHYVFPMFLPCPGVVTVHDCIHLRFPRQLPSPVAGVYAKLMIRRAVRAADRVLVGSEATRADLVELVDADPSKIAVIPYGCDPFFLESVDTDELEAVGTTHELDRPFLLSVTNIKPHKNLGRLIQAFAQLHRDHKDLELVIAGGEIANHPELGKLIAEHHLDDHVRTLGFVSKRELRALYHLARIFVFPSLYEGFGFPPLEAMACGTAVVASRSSAIPEVVGRSGLLVNPFRVDAIAEAIRSLLQNDGLREALSRQGRTRAEGFDWDDSARRVLAVYREVTS